MDKNDNQNECKILYIMVVGFHHKKGCLIDYCYPPLPKTGSNNNKNNDDDNDLIINNDNDTNLNCDNNKTIELPKCWKSLPSLAIPDGAHNFERDTVFFHLPDLNNYQRTVFGIACYQQIMTKILRVRTPDMTRSSVQKSVVIILNAPLYGYIERKLRIITRNYFQELDFSQTKILEEFYHSISLQLKTITLNDNVNEIFIGLSIRALFEKFGQQVIVLFKLLLLEKKILFIMSPIRELSGVILTLCSLIPGLLQNGMTQSHFSSDTMQYNRTIVNDSESQSKEEDILNKIDEEKSINEAASSTINEISANKPVMSSSIASTISANNNDDRQHSENNSTEDPLDFDSMNMIVDLNFEYIDDEDDDKDNENHFKEIIRRKTLRKFREILVKPPEYYELPLQLFKCHSYCLPYCSISCFENLNDPNVRSCIAGSSNSILQRWQNDIDVFVSNDQITIEDNQLKRILIPTVEDLRFITFLIQSLSLDDSSGSDDDDDDDNNNNDRIRKFKCYQPDLDEDYDEYLKNLDKNQQFQKGSDAWCRYYFKNYLLHMLRCSFLNETDKDYKAFNVGFMNEWKQTYSYKLWLNTQNANGKTMIEKLSNEIDPQHPFAGNRFNDIRFKIKNSLNNYHEQINNASKVVLNTAKSTFNSWISSISTTNSGQQAKSFLNKTLQLANNWIDEQNSSGNGNRQNSLTNNKIISSSSSSLSSFDDNNDEQMMKNSRQNRNRKLLKNDAKQTLQQFDRNNKNKSKYGSTNNLSNEMNTVEEQEEQETSV